MKRILFFLFVALTAQSINAQNVGIGTTAPNFDALLDISSTTKGVLFPRMTSTQRINIPTPPNGLMVFDTDRNELYQYISATLSWRALINDSYWRRQTLNRSRIGNLSDSVGIGTLSPTEWLDVDGNIRTRNNLIADNNVVATGGVSGATISTPGNLTVIGTSFLNGNVTTNSDLIVNNTTATLQLKSSSVNKGFFQLSGDNVRMGTNSGNTGNLIMRMNGNDRITVNPSGDIDLDGKITRTAVTGPSSLLPICYGFVNYTGSILSGTNNFSVTRLSEGRYRITCTDLNIYSIILLTVTTPDRIAGAYQPTPTTINVDINSVSIQGAPRDEYFYFVAYRPG